ncbi:MAG TPA: vanadium-dependent haloperoxidase [Candidatus Binatia bacterium]|nr:vanadium-dependent haloperoxidase [Candidatus Binatia bacterium]
MIAGISNLLTRGKIMERIACIFLAGWLFVSLHSTVRADMIADWNEKAVNAGNTARVGNFPTARAITMVHLAMFEALNSIEQRYTPYRARVSADPNASKEAAAASAAHTVLVRVYPEQAAELDKALQSSLSAVTDGAPKTQGIQIGQQAGAMILAERTNDGSDAPNNYRPFTVVGKYVPTVLPIGWTVMSVKPFSLKSGNQLRPPAPYSLKSAQWAKDFNEVKRMGAKTGSGRNVEQTDIARFWELTGPATYNPVVRQLSVAKGLDILDNARLFALFSMATADASIAIFDAKYAYNFWRPVTAIRNADMDNNNATERDPNWEPMITTPMHPEYPCAHCISQGSAASVLEAFFGDAVPTFTMTSTTAPGVTRKFSRLSDYVTEVVNARVYDGVHYRTSGEVGAAMGRKNGQYAVQNYLKPIGLATAR